MSTENCNQLLNALSFQDIVLIFTYKFQKFSSTRKEQQDEIAQCGQQVLIVLFLLLKLGVECLDQLRERVGERLQLGLDLRDCLSEFVLLTCLQVVYSRASMGA